MPQDLFSSPPGDDEEPGSFPLPPAAEEEDDPGFADKHLAEAAPGMTFGEVRSAAHKLVLKLDPEAVRKRKEAGKRQTHVRPFRENSGNAGMVAGELPSDEVLASWQHVEQRALDLRAAADLAGSFSCLR